MCVSSGEVNDQQFPLLTSKLPIKNYPLKENVMVCIVAAGALVDIKSILVAC